MTSQERKEILDSIKTHVECRKIVANDFKSGILSINQADFLFSYIDDLTKELQKHHDESITHECF